MTGALWGTARSEWSEHDGHTWGTGPGFISSSGWFSLSVFFLLPLCVSSTVRRVAPRFSILPVSHEIMPGGNVNITCVAVGSPMPYVKWMQGAEDLTPEDDMPVGRNVLELTDVKDSANYTCVAMSSLGVIEAVAQITVKLGMSRGFCLRGLCVCMGEPVTA
uniref:protein-tyrosine-phosphatase n=1 Tax=Malurus cyaneus samueli TaxID=2593467 RepID=A0A8C5TZ40_9PASS